MGCGERLPGGARCKGRNMKTFVHGAWAGLHCIPSLNLLDHSCLWAAVTPAVTGPLTYVHPRCKRLRNWALLLRHGCAVHTGHATPTTYPRDPLRRAMPAWPSCALTYPRSDWVGSK